MKFQPQDCKKTQKKTSPLFYNYMLFVNFSGTILQKFFKIFSSSLLEFLKTIHCLKYNENQRNCKNLEYPFRDHFSPLFCQLLKNATFFFLHYLISFWEINFLLGKRNPHLVLLQFLLTKL